MLKGDYYDLLIEAQFLEEFDGIINQRNQILSLLGYQVPFYYFNRVVKGLRIKFTFLIEYPHHILLLHYQVLQGKIKLPLKSSTTDKDVPVYFWAQISIPEKSHFIVNLGIQLRYHPSL